MGPLERYKKYTEEYGLNPKDADILIADKRISDFYNQAVEVYPNPKTVANFILVELLRRINLGEADLDTLPFTAVDFARLVEIMDTEKINKNNGKTVLRIMLETGKKPDEIAEEQNLWIQQDNALIERVVTDVLAANPAAVEQYKNGETKVFGFLMGQCNKQLKGSATPNAIKEILEKKLGE
jgi:aspartyl-tRNA(Asn)/glutamyl-tRNA(Gln) amidotransferase subunit B